MAMGQRRTSELMYDRVRQRERSESLAGCRAALIGRGIDEHGAIDCICPCCGETYQRAKKWGARKCLRCESIIRLAQAIAHSDVCVAIRKGLLRPASEFPCSDCGCKAVEYDHRDYSQPLKVDPVCRGCNLKRGTADISAIISPPRHASQVA